MRSGFLLLSKRFTQTTTAECLFLKKEAHSAAPPDVCALENLFWKSENVSRKSLNALPKILIPPLGH
jgi:hypothetical protein